ncbi:hypothetical protein V9K67_12100 [Paraflavisolibacter sp. H34]|uniref:toxin-antitoxin system YwqK family antitoxin n=1 Tax=Huijunlia imazamoxiresistens TaxID=3127457 RepID=UPI0030169934
MTTKNMLIALSALFCFSAASGQELPSGFVAPDYEAAAGAVAAPAARNHESILENPSVHKKELSRHQVRATGFHFGEGKHFVIHFRKEQLHGPWESFYNNKQRCDSGTLDRGLPDGAWKTWYPNGQLKSEHHYSARKYRYIQADLQRNHPRYQRYALTRQAQQKGDVSAHFKPKYPGAPAAATTASLTLLQKIQHNTGDRPEGYAAPFDRCVHHGPYVNYDEQGRVKDSGHYTDGLKDGLWTETLADGTTHASGLYNHGVRSGQWKFYNAEGKLLYTEQYDRNGKKSTPHHFKRAHTKKVIHFHH